MTVPSGARSAAIPYAPPPVPDRSVDDLQLRESAPSDYTLLRQGLAVFTVLSGLRYFAWRFDETMNPQAPWFFYLFITTELVAFISSVLFIVTTWRMRQYVVPPPLPGRTVDIFITTYNEPASLVRDTALCAMGVRYPHRTFILDDGNRAEIAELAAELGCDYVGRTDRSHAKAGNLNNGLRYSSAEFVVTLDADHVPLPSLIEEMIGFFADQSVGIVQANQDFYNLDSFQHEVNWRGKKGWQMQELFFSVIQPGKEAFNATIYCGSPAMLRRTALDEIGGFGVGTVTEDMHTGLRMHKAGRRVLYLNRSLARGLAPQTFVGYVNQWKRWGTGSMQVLRLENPFLSRKLTLGQRLCYFASYEYNLTFSYARLLSILTVIFAIFTGIFPLLANPRTYAEHYVPFLIGNFATAALLGRSALAPILMERYNFVKIFAQLSSFSGILRQKVRFAVTPKTTAPAGDLRHAWMYLLLMAGLYASAIFGIVQAWDLESGARYWAYLVTSAFATYNFGVAAPAVARLLQRREVRNSYRFPQSLDVNVAFEAQLLGRDGRIPMMGRSFARNMNRDGLSLTLDDALPIGTFVRLELEIDGRYLPAFGQVAWTESFVAEKQTRHANGIRYHLVNVDDQDVIARYLFWTVAPKHGEMFRLTKGSQRGSVA